MCKICKAEDGEYLSLKVIEGKLTITQLAKEYGLDYNTAWDHLRNHVKPPDTSKENPIGALTGHMTTEEMIKTLQYVLSHLRLRADEYLAAPKGDSDRTSMLIVKELRGIINDIGVLEGKIQRSPMIQLNQYNIAFEKITSILLTGLCDECRPKISETLTKVVIPESIGENAEALTS